MGVNPLEVEGLMWDEHGCDFNAVYNTWKIARIIAKSRFNEAHSIKIKTVS